MKKILLIVFVMYVGLTVNAQEKNGSVFIKHPAIETTKKLWSAFEKGDKAAYSSLLADSLVVIFNGSRDVQKKEDHLKSFDWWSREFENLKIKDDAPAFPDAIEYAKGGTWVQDWLLVTGIHKNSGVSLDMHMHNLYSLNKDGKIAAMFFYYDDTQLNDIGSSASTMENGKVYINHPLIAEVRKLVNAYVAKNVAEMSKYYSPNVRFHNSTMKYGQSINLDERKKDLETNFSQMDNVKMRQVGYPDCIYYAKNDGYVVYSWWVHSSTSKADGKKTEFPIMLSHSFNKDGKIITEDAYYSSNHWDEQ